MPVLEHLRNYIDPSRTEYQGVIAELREKMRLLRDELTYRERLIRLIDSLESPLLVAHVNDRKDVTRLEPRREGGLEDVTNNDEEQTNVGISHITVYQFAMTLLETLTYENSLSRHEKSHQDELLEAYPALYDLAYICSRHAAVNGYFLAGEKSMPGPADSRAARVIVRKCLGADTLQQYRVAEIRAWKEAKHQLQCVSTAQTFITFSKSSPGNDDPQTRSIISAMLSDIQGFSTRTHFVPAEPHPSDAARIREPRVFFDEEHLGRLIETFDETSREYLLKKAVSARQMIVAAPFPFPIATL